MIKMICLDFRLQRFILILINIIISKVPHAESNNGASLKCNRFQAGKQTTCNCTIDTSSGSGTCSQYGQNAAYLTTGDRLVLSDSDPPFKGTPATPCLCCFQDWDFQSEQPDLAEKVANGQCETVSGVSGGGGGGGGKKVLQAVYAPSQDDSYHSVSCVVPCLGASAHLAVDFGDGADVPLGLVIGGAVGGFIVLLLLALLFGYLGVKHQRKQAWVVLDNKPVKPPPMPTVQNSGLMYIVDPNGLVLPLCNFHDLMEQSQGGGGGGPSTSTRSVSMSATLATSAGNQGGNAKTCAAADTNVDANAAGSQPLSLKRGFKVDKAGDITSVDSTES